MDTSTLDLKDLHPNEYVLMTCAEQSTGVAKYNSQTKRLEALSKITKDIWGIQPLNVEQRCALDLLLRDEIQLITLLGPAGTGKTLMALATGMKKVFDDNIYTKILVSRPIMPLGKDIGFLPGTKDEKLFHWMQPIFDNLEYSMPVDHRRCLQRGDAAVDHGQQKDRDGSGDLHPRKIASQKCT